MKNSFYARHLRRETFAREKAEQSGELPGPGAALCSVDMSLSASYLSSLHISSKEYNKIREK